MSRLWALTARELRSQLVSPVAWTVAAGYLLLAGYFFFNLVARFAALVTRATAVSRTYGNAEWLQTLNLNDLVVSRFLTNQLLLLVFVMPLLTMRSVAEERRQGTDELILTAPVGPGTVAAAKFLGIAAIAGAIVTASAGYLAILMYYGDPETGPLWTGMLGLALVAAALVALGIAVSSITDNQVVAAVGSFVLFLMLFLVDGPAATLGGALGATLEGLSLPSHFEGFRRGVVTSPDVVYFLSLIALGLIVTRSALASQRWR